MKEYKLADYRRNDFEAAYAGLSPKSYRDSGGSYGVSDVLNIAWVAWKRALSRAQPVQSEPVTGEQIQKLIAEHENGLGFILEPMGFAKALLALSHVQDIWQPMETAPKDGTMLRLLVQFDDNATEDSEGPCPTIGANTFDHSGLDEWKFAGWDWSQDCFTEGIGTPVGWLPFGDSSLSEQEKP